MVVVNIIFVSIVLLIGIQFFLSIIQLFINEFRIMKISSRIKTRDYNVSKNIFNETRIKIKSSIRIKEDIFGFFSFFPYVISYNYEEKNTYLILIFTPLYFDIRRILKENKINSYNRIKTVIHNEIEDIEDEVFPQLKDVSKKKMFL